MLYAMQCKFGEYMLFHFFSQVPSEGDDVKGMILNYYCIM